MTHAPQPSPTLLDLARETLECVRALRPLQSETSVGAYRRAEVFLETKVLPELRRGLALPIFVGVQGGTNTGKSTVLNALAGRILSPALVVAAATKHPLVYVHARWREALLDPSLFASLERRELVDPKELISDAERTDLVFLRFHDDDRLGNLAIVDSPDFDSSLTSNAIQAARIAALSDVTLFVTTAQKYRDLRLLEELVAILELKAHVVVLFNQVDEHVVFETLWDDLRAQLPEGGARPEAVRLPRVDARYPEEELEGLLEEQVLARLSLLRAEEIKPRTVSLTFRRLSEVLGEVVASYGEEVRQRQRVEAYAAAQADAAREEYAAQSRLSFPEETVVIRRVLSLTELGTLLTPSRELQRHSPLVGFVGGVIERVSETVRRLLVRLSRRDEGWIDSSPESLAEYAASRNQADTELTQHIVEGAYLRTESLVREKERSSAMARELVRELFAPESAAGFARRVRDVHQARLGAAPGTGSDWVEAVDAWIRAHPGRVKAFTGLTLGAKLALGLLAAWLLPPDKGALGFLSPVKWATFAGGYLLGAYGVSLLVCLALRRRGRFLRARARLFDETLDETYEARLREALDRLVDEARLRRLESLTGALRQGAPPKGSEPFPDRAAS